MAIWGRSGTKLFEIVGWPPPQSKPELQIAAASPGAIAERIGVSKGAISYYSASKNELLREVVVHVLTEASQYMRPRIEPAGSALDAHRDPERDAAGLLIMSSLG